MSGVVDDDEAPTEGAEPAMDELLATYRERKRRALQERHGEGAGPSSVAPPRAPPSPADSPVPGFGSGSWAATPPATVPPLAAPGPAVPPLPPPPSPQPTASPPAAATNPPAAPPSPAGSPSPGSLLPNIPPPGPPSATGSGPAVAPENAPAGGPAASTTTPTDVTPNAAPGAQLTVPAGPGALSALGPALKLSEALLADRIVTVRGLPAGRIAGLALVLVGLALAVLDRRAAFIAGTSVLIAGIPFLFVAIAIVLLGGALAGLFVVVPSQRRLAVRLEPTQAQEWTRIQKQAKGLRVMAQAGAGAAIVALLVAAAVYAVAPEGGLVGAAAGLALFVALAGALVAGAAVVRLGLARRLYVQTLVLSGLERTGLGATDARVAPVLLALDELLGALPADKVQQFLSSPQAQAYLDLIDEAGRTHGQ